MTVAELKKYVDFAYAKDPSTDVVLEKEGLGVHPVDSAQYMVVASSVLDAGGAETKTELCKLVIKMQN